MLDILYTIYGSSISVLDFTVYTSVLLSTVLLARGIPLGFLPVILSSGLYFYVSPPSAISYLFTLLVVLLSLNGMVNWVSSKWNNRLCPHGVFFVSVFVIIMSSFYMHMDYEYIMHTIGSSVELLTEIPYVPTVQPTPGLYGLSVTSLLLGLWMVSRRYTTGWFFMTASAVVYTLSNTDLGSAHIIPLSVIYMAFAITWAFFSKDEVRYGHQ